MENRSERPPLPEPEAGGRDLNEIAEDWGCSVEEACDRKADRVGCNQAPALQGVGQMPTDLGQHREVRGIRMGVVEVGQSGYQVSAQGADQVLGQVARQILQSR